MWKELLFGAWFENFLKTPMSDSEAGCGCMGLIVVVIGVPASSSCRTEKMLP